MRSNSKGFEIEGLREEDDSGFGMLFSELLGLIVFLLISVPLLVCLIVWTLVSFLGTLWWLVASFWLALVIVVMLLLLSLL